MINIIAALFRNPTTNFINICNIEINSYKLSSQRLNKAHCATQYAALV